MEQKRASQISKFVSQIEVTARRLRADLKKHPSTGALEKRLRTAAVALEKQATSTASHVRKQAEAIKKEIARTAKTAKKRVRKAIPKRKR